MTDAAKRDNLNQYTKPWEPSRRLTERQFEVVALLFHDDLNYSGVADKLGISARTVRQHVDDIASWLPGEGQPSWKVLRYAERLLDLGFDEEAA